MRGELARREGLVSLLAVPLTVRDRVIGVFNCYMGAATDFTEEQRALFSTLANHTALAIENSRLITHAAVVREMHHRIKNNLQTIAMLMRLQLADAGRLDARQVLEASIHRVHSIAAVHEALSERGFHLVDLHAVLLRIVHLAAESAGAAGRNIAVELAGETLLLPTRAATNVALAVNELLQNAFDHAFVGRTEGRVAVSFGHTPEGFVIAVADDGRGLSGAYRRGLGLEIVETLVRDDLGGRLRFNRPAAGGTEITIRLPRMVEYELQGDERAPDE
jgi:two-component sensor histidine kinase